MPKWWCLKDVDIAESLMDRLVIAISGCVQGIGFRPFRLSPCKEASFHRLHQQYDFRRFDRCAGGCTRHSAFPTGAQLIKPEKAVIDDVGVARAGPAA